MWFVPVSLSYRKPSLASSEEVLSSPIALMTTKRPKNGETLRGQSFISQVALSHVVTKESRVNYIMVSTIQPKPLSNKNIRWAALRHRWSLQKELMWKTSVFAVKICLGECVINVVQFKVLVKGRLFTVGIVTHVKKKFWRVHILLRLELHPLNVLQNRRQLGTAQQWWRIAAPLWRRRRKGKGDAAVHEFLSNFYTSKWENFNFFPRVSLALKRACQRLQRDYSRRIRGALPGNTTRTCGPPPPPPPPPPPGALCLRLRDYQAEFCSYLVSVFK